MALIALISFSQVDVMYWPIPGAKTACLDSGMNAGVNPATATVPPSNNSVSTTIGPDGFTYTSPSIYLAYHDISASNSCGQVGPKHTSITLSFQPDQLSTIEYRAGLFGFGGYPGEPKPFDLKNLPCPPQSLTDAQESANVEHLMLPARGTYAPIIAPPLAIKNLEPAWKMCFSFYAFDPPKTLAAAVAMVPSPTSAEQADAQITSAIPRPIVDGPPAQTSATGRTADVGQTGKLDAPKGDPTNVAYAMTAADPNNDPVVKPASVSGTRDPSSIQKLSNDFRQPSANPGIDVSSGSEFVAGSSIKMIPSTKNQNNDFTSADHASTPQPDPGVNMIGNVLSIDKPAVIVAGPAISLDLSGPVVSSQTIAISTPAPDQIISPTAAIAVGGHTVRPLSDSGVIVEGATLSTNGPDITVSGTAVSLAPSRVAIGSQTYALPTSVLGTAGHIVIFDGTTLTAGSPVITIAGTPMSLATGTAGLYVTGLGPGSTAFSAPVIAGESISVDSAGQLAVNGKTVSGSEIGSMGLGSAIMLGFGAASTAANPSPTGGDSSSISSNGSSATGVLGFTGDGQKRVNSTVMATLLPILIFIGLHICNYIEF